MCLKLKGCKNYKQFSAGISILMVCAENNFALLGNDNSTPFNNKMSWVFESKLQSFNN